MRRCESSALTVFGALALLLARTAAWAGADVRINDPSTDLPESTTQSEITLAALGSTLCAAYVDTGRGTLSGYARSEDAGQSWSDLGALPQQSDPVLAVHLASGRFFLAKNGFIGPGTAITVARSEDDCRTFSPPVNASPASGGFHQQDKPWIAVDNSGGERDGAVYACWTRFVNAFPGPATSGELRFSRSIDGGLSFEDDQVISTAEEEFPFGCHIAVGPTGIVYVTWVVRGGPERGVRLRRSIDGGTNWDSPVQINSADFRTPGEDRIIECEPGQFRTTLAGDIRMIDQTWLAVDNTGGPFAGNLYVVWAADPDGDIDNSDVLYSRSTDGGATWSPQAQLGVGSPTDQFEPFVAVGGRGSVGVAWYDRRNDPNNFDIDVYASISRDGGRSFDPIERVTDVSFSVPPLTGQPSATGNFDSGRSACYMGEYIAVTADEDYFYLAWGDNRNSIVSATYPDGRADPDVYFDRIAVPPIVDPADANCDGRTTAADVPALVQLIAASTQSTCDTGDVNQDGMVDARDLPSALTLLFPAATAG